MRLGALARKKPPPARPKPRTGLVLSGGGARGAYQVGALKALCEAGTRFDAISGASIGALSGAVLAGAPSLAAGVARLEALWRRLAERPPLKLDENGVRRLLDYSPGADAPGLLQAALRGVCGNNPLALAVIDQVTDRMETPRDDVALFDDAPLRARMEEFLDMDGLERGLPLHVSIYRGTEGVSGALVSLAEIALASAGMRDTSRSRFFHVQGLPREARKETLLASAAIPLLFAAKSIGGKSYLDGGIGGWTNDQGNTPILPLLEMGCKRVVVVNASSASPWNRHDFPGIDILEIRPRATGGTGWLASLQNLLDFSEKTVTGLMARGYADAKRHLE
jgi:NTE family protein